MCINSMLIRGSLIVTLLAGSVAGDEVTPVLLRGGTVVGKGRADVLLEGKRIAMVGEVDAVPDGAEVIDVAGKFLAPSFVDSHVHLRYYPVEKRLAKAGIAAAVDLAAPMEFLEKEASRTEGLRLVLSGPMITARGGYPVASWGRDGYGLEVVTEVEASRAVERLHGAGARIIKLPITAAPVLSEAVLKAAATRAHELGLKVTCHALSDREALLAAAIGADLLAHTPVEPLSDETLEAWKGKAVISTLLAFGGSEAAVDNLRKLRAAGALVLYGTDLGNTRTPAIDGKEIELLQKAGLDGAAILQAGTGAPAKYWGFEGLGSLDRGSAGCVIVLEEDPLLDPVTLSRPLQVFLDGEQLR